MVHPTRIESMLAPIELAVYVPAFLEAPQLEITLSQWACLRAACLGALRFKRHPSATTFRRAILTKSSRASRTINAPAALASSLHHAPSQTV